MRATIALGVLGQDIHVFNKHFPNGLDIISQPTYGRVLFRELSHLMMEKCWFGPKPGTGSVIRIEPQGAQWSRD